jgi:hypothetical protein
MNPDQAGYSVFFLPPLFVLLWPSGKCVVVEMSRLTVKRYVAAATTVRLTAVAVVIVNAIFFLLSHSVVSARGIREHDNDLFTIFQGIERNFPPEQTVIVDDNSY